MDDEAIGNLLEDSDMVDFIPSDYDFDDPEFVPPESSMSSTEEEIDGLDIREKKDQTPVQKQYLKQLKEELKKRREKGKKDLIIKYIKGTPSIAIGVLGAHCFVQASTEIYYCGSTWVYG
ncbi:unnamed protein product [Parnassius apollo]|uniref:(apollo) hypothetical protein n=1 Tax=Parnassius apollo TaxID=110799 RepID=A0A8S3WF45_PARAO|nr:unnamed protein product [Parnassius apollo]